MKLYMFWTVRLSTIRSLFSVHSAMVYVIQVCRQLSSRSICSCSKAVWQIPLLSVQWINSWWWTEELSETCRVSHQNKFVKLMRLVGFIIKKFVTVKFFPCLWRTEICVFSLRRMCGVITANSEASALCFNRALRYHNGTWFSFQYSLNTVVASFIPHVLWWLGAREEMSMYLHVKYWLCVIELNQHWRTCTCTVSCKYLPHSSSVRLFCNW